MCGLAVAGAEPGIDGQGVTPATARLLGPLHFPVTKPDLCSDLPAYYHSHPAGMIKSLTSLMDCAPVRD